MTESPEAQVAEILDLLKAKKVQYAFSHSKTGKDMAVAAAMTALGLTLERCPRYG